MPSRVEDTPAGRLYAFIIFAEAQALMEMARAISAIEY